MLCSFLSCLRQKKDIYISLGQGLDIYAYIPICKLICSFPALKKGFSKIAGYKLSIGTNLTVYLGGGSLTKKIWKQLQQD